MTKVQVVKTTDYTEFINSFGSSRKRELATAMVTDGVTPELTEDYGVIRIQEMQKMIDLYTEDPDKFIRCHIISVCKTC